jgi:hypothetical protein
MFDENVEDACNQLIWPFQNIWKLLCYTEYKQELKLEFNMQKKIELQKILCNRNEKEIYKFCGFCQASVFQCTIIEPLKAENFKIYHK